HPYFGSGRTTTASWDMFFGNASQTLPVVADEWGEYESNGGECVTQGPTLVPQFLAYLKMRKVGVIGFSVWPGTLIRGWNFSTPTAFDQSPYTCTQQPFPNVDPMAQGAGALLADYLAHL